MQDHEEPNRKLFSLEDIARIPAPGMAVPVNFQFSSDDKVVTYLYSPQHNLVNQLSAYDLTSGHHKVIVSPAAGLTENELSLEEKLRRERERQRALGISTYEWSKKGQKILYPLGRCLYVKDGLDNEARELPVAEGKPVIDPHFSPDGRMVSYVQDGEIYVIDLEGGEPSQVTSGARETGKTNGLAEFIAQEEMGRRRGYWWSPDSRLIAFVEVDETHIPIYRIMHQGKPQTGDTAQEDHRYPFAGTENAHVRLGVVPTAGGEVTWMNLDGFEDFYLARVDWLPDGRLSAQIENREQSVLELVVFDPMNGYRSLLLREESDIWINLHDMFRPLSIGDSGTFDGFVWASERSGYRHLYHYDSAGRQIRQLTSGDWMVDSLVGIDQKRGFVYFTATRKTPLESHLYRVPLSGGMPQRLTQEPGMHQVVMDHRCLRYVDSYNNLQQPPVINLVDVESRKTLSVLFKEEDPRTAELGLEPPQVISFTNDAGEVFFGALYLPTGYTAVKPLPTIVHVYGGPHAQMVQNDWDSTVNMRAQYLARQGFCVFMMDNRGSARRGLAFEGHIKHRMGTMEVEDQAFGVSRLVELGITDPERVGVYGWSYGGYMSALCLVKKPGIFKVAVAGAPVTHYDGYDTHYTERYMSTPQKNPDGYDNGSVMAHVDNLQGKLMIVHGLIDENVHFRHTARLINALIAARKPYELLLFPDERHMPRKLEDRVYMEERICKFFVENL